MNENELENADITNCDHLCIVSGKSVDEGGGLCHIKAGARMIALCCLLCIETFNKDPMHYLRLRQAREWGQAGPFFQKEHVTDEDATNLCPGTAGTSGLWNARRNFVATRSNLFRTAGEPDAKGGAGKMGDDEGARAAVVVPYIMGTRVARLVWRSRIRFYRSYQHR